MQSNKTYPSLVDNRATRSAFSVSFCAKSASFCLHSVCKVIQAQATNQEITRPKFKTTDLFHNLNKLHCLSLKTFNLTVCVLQLAVLVLQTCEARMIRLVDSFQFSSYFLEDEKKSIFEAAVQLAARPNLLTLCSISSLCTSEPFLANSSCMCV